MIKYIIATFLFLTSFYQVNAQKKLKVVSSVSMIADMVENLSGDKLDTEMIVPIGGDPHLHEPTPRDAALVSSADLVLINGLTFEGWITELIDNSGTTAKTITITEGINALSSTQYANSFDPHAWMDASNGLIYIKNIHKALVQFDPANKETYDRNYESYKKEIQELDVYITDKIRQIPLDKRVLITSHDAFAYYGQRYGIRLEALMGISTDAAIQTSDMMRVTKVIRENNVPAIFVESTINPKVIQQIAKDNDIVIGGELFADSIGDKDSDAPSYVSMLRHNTDTIFKALSGGSGTSEGHVHEEENKSQNLLLYLLAGLLLVGGLFIAIRKLNI